MRDFMISRSMRGLRGALPISVSPGSLAMTDVTITTPTEPPVSGKPGTTITKKGGSSSPLMAAAVRAATPATPRFTTKETGSPSGSLLRVASVRLPDAVRGGSVSAGSSGAPIGNAVAEDDAVLAAGAEARNVEGDIGESGVVYGSSGSATTSSALSSFWARYSVYLSLGGGALLALLLWLAMGRRRR